MPHPASKRPVAMDGHQRCDRRRSWAQGLRKKSCVDQNLRPPAPRASLSRASRWRTCSWSPPWGLASCPSLAPVTSPRVSGRGQRTVVALGRWGAELVTASCGPFREPALTSLGPMPPVQSERCGGLFFKIQFLIVLCWDSGNMVSAVGLLPVALLSPAVSSGSSQSPSLGVLYSDRHVVYKQGLFYFFCFSFLPHGRRASVPCRERSASPAQR